MITIVLIILPNYDDVTTTNNYDHANGNEQFYFVATIASDSKTNNLEVKQKQVRKRRRVIMVVDKVTELSDELLKKNLSYTDDITCQRPLKVSLCNFQFCRISLC